MSTKGERPVIFISLGSNLGHRLQFLARAVDLLKARVFRTLTCSLILETECLLKPHAPESWNKPYLNMVVGGESDLSPCSLLAALKQIEREMGRPEIYEKWAPRVIDLDILLWDGWEQDSPTLKIPHPELQNRPFLRHLLASLGRKEFQKDLTSSGFSKSLTLEPRWVGIVNVTPDSFSDGGVFETTDKAVSQIHHHAAAGAMIVEIGACSTRPGAALLTPAEELARLIPVLDALDLPLRAGEIALGVDSFQPEVIRAVLDHAPIAWINDVSGALDEKTLSLIAERGCSLCLMHALTVPADPRIILSEACDPVEKVYAWAEEKIAHARRCGLTKDKIIIDPGIGFGKTAFQSLALLQRLDDLKGLGVPLLVGHSRKSWIASFSTVPAAARDIETIAASLALFGKADYFRVHDVAAHQRAFVAQHILQGGIHVA